MKRMGLIFIAAAIVLGGWTLQAQTEWNIDPVHSSAQFSVRHLMISSVNGSFDKMSGKVQFDGKDYASVQSEAAIQTASIDTREPQRDDHLRSADFFDANNYPTIEFKSKRVEDIRGNTFKLVGDLTIRGITKEVSLDVEASPIVQGMQGESRIGVHAITQLDRQDFGVKWNRVLDTGGIAVGNEVRITLDLELVKSP